MPFPSLRDFDALTFDCYGTLIDWETGILQNLATLTSQLPQTDTNSILEDYAKHESSVQLCHPAMIYPEVLRTVYRRLANQWGLDSVRTNVDAFGNSVKTWPCFEDSVAALRYLQTHFKLVILSNIDRASFAWSEERLGIRFDAVYTAEEIGSYKPDPANFRHLIDGMQARFGIGASRVLHVAQSLFHDHAPANAIGLAGAWIDRRHDRQGWGATLATHDMPHYDRRYRSMAEFVLAHQEELAEDP